MLSGIDHDTFEAELFDVLKASTSRNILEIYLPRGLAVQYPPVEALEEALLRQIRAFMSVGNNKNECVRVHVHVFEPELMDYFMKAEISFDGSLHLEAAKALEQIDGKPLPGCQQWQKMKSQHLFHSIVSCSAFVFAVIKDQLHALLKNLELQKGAKFVLDKNDNGSYRVKITATATKIMAESRRPLEQLMNGKTINDPRLTTPILQLILSREGFAIQKTIQRETGTYLLFDRHNQSFRIFGPLTVIDRAQQCFVNTLVTLHETKQLDVHLRGPDFPPNLMKKVVGKFGPDLHGLKEKFPGSDFTLNTRHHTISVRGNKELKQKVEETIHPLVKTSTETESQSQTASCPICLCDVEDGFRLEKCGHEFCRMCLIEQCESAMKSHSGFPLICAHENCPAMILMVDLRSLLAAEKLEELFRASLGSFVGSSGGKYKYCPSPDCPAVYRAAEKGGDGGGGGHPFVCGACSVETCRQCHLEYHPFLSCDKYKEFKRDPDMSLKEWMRWKEDVRVCPGCGFAIEKVDGCNHMECKCGRHICWVCLHFLILVGLLSSYERRTSCK